MHNVNVTTLQLLTILATLDDVRAIYFEKAYIADCKGDESHAKNHYETADRYETIILSLQVQMKGEPS
jgi:hypothetical protein